MVPALSELTHLHLKASVMSSLKLEHGFLSLRRAWPESDGRLTLEYQTERATIVAARLFGRSGREQATLQRIAGELRLRAAGAVSMVPEHGLLLQSHGADRRLLPLAQLLAAKGTTLLGHRAERRAVVRRARGPNVHFAKVVPRSRVTGLLRGARAAAPAPIRTPRLLVAARHSGLTIWSSLPGRPVGELMVDRPAAVGRLVGKMVRILHDHVAPLELPTHRAEDEVGVVEEWLQRLGAFTHPPVSRDSVGALTDHLAGPTANLVPIHRDLHDGQILVDDAGGVGLLDLDTMSLGEAALDLANLLVHLELGVLLGRWSEAAACAFAGGVLDAYHPASDVLCRLVGYAAATRLRLVCVYAFRPGPDPTEGLLKRLWESPPGIREHASPALAGRP